MTAKAFRVDRRETWRDGDEVSFNLFAVADGEKMFTPGATVTRDRRRRSGGLQVSVTWSSSSSNSQGILVAEAQLAVMAEALDLAHALEKEIA